MNQPTPTEGSIHLTEDGSPTVYSARTGEHYHSTHGALQESRQVFIEAGLRHRLRQPLPEDGVLRVLEIGFGTGLNALLTLEVSTETACPVHYTTLELYPLEPSVYSRLAYPTACPDDALRQLHDAPWDSPYAVGRHFTLEKVHTDIGAYCLERSIMQTEWLDVVYLDAFSPEVQPDLWREELLRAIARAMRSGGVLTTYCAKGEIRRRLQRAGLIVERLPGPPGKREMLRATRP